MLKKISIITTLFLLFFSIQGNLYANQSSKNSSKIEKQKPQQKKQNIQSKNTKTKTDKKSKSTQQNKIKKNKVENKKIVKTNNKVAKNKNTKLQKIAKVNKNQKSENNYSNSYAYLNKNEKVKVFNEFYNETKHIKYRMGGTGKNGIDCSAFIQKMFKEKFDYTLSRSTITQVNEGIEVKKSELQPGDLVFFKTSKVDKHVGVYTGNGEFLHASIKGIQYTKLDKPFYKDSYWTARRVIN